jgi:GDP-D-mannose dehydratase
MQIINFNEAANSFLNNHSENNGKNKILSHKNTIFFSKLEFTLILNLYSKQVALGSWRDYAIDSKIDIAVFSIYRHTHDKPMYQFLKTSKKGYRNNPDFFIKDSNKIIFKGKGLKQVGINSETNKVIIKVSKKHFREKEVDNLRANSNKIKKYLNWKPKITIDHLITDMIKNET